MTVDREIIYTKDDDDVNMKESPAAVSDMAVDKPWLGFYGEIPTTIEYPNQSMVSLIIEKATKNPELIATDFFGCTFSYGVLAEQVQLCARGLADIGIMAGQRVTICLPNTPQAVVMFYAINLIGAVANMVHPLSPEEELARILIESESVAVLTLDQFADKLLGVLSQTPANTLFLSGIDDGLTGLKSKLYGLTKGRKIKRLKSAGNVLRYKDLLNRGRRYEAEYKHEGKGSDIAVIIYSGGTSGTSKGVLLTNMNVNALAMQAGVLADCLTQGNKMLAILPVFHGFGLGVCIHTSLLYGLSVILMPQFSMEAYLKVLRKQKPNYIAGVPTMFEALLRMENTDNLDLSQLQGIFCGGDSLSIELKNKVDKFLKERGCKEQVREGYGLTESVTVNCLTPRRNYKEGSIGIPLPDMLIKIVKPGTTEKLPLGIEGEIVVSGPTVMLGYNNNEEETAQTLKQHYDGRTWLHTGDIGLMDEDGFVYFKQRMKRMIITAGFNVYPSALENIIESHESVLISCVIGVPDELKVQCPKAFIILKDGIEPTEEIKNSIIKHCEKKIVKYAMPKEFEYRKELPRTMIGKVAYLELEKEEEAKRAKP